MLADAHYDLVVLDELTYMLAYHYLDTQEVIAAIENRPAEQSVIVTGRGCHTLYWNLPIRSVRCVRSSTRLIAVFRHKLGLTGRKNTLAYNIVGRRCHHVTDTTDLPSNQLRKVCKCGDSAFSSRHVIMNRLPVRIGTSQESPYHRSPDRAE